MNQGKVLEVVGARVDLDFSGAELPDIMNAVEVTRADESKLILEVQQHLGRESGSLHLDGYNGWDCSRYASKRHRWPNHSSGG